MCSAYMPVSRVLVTVVFTSCLKSVTDLLPILPKQAMKFRYDKLLDHINFNQVKSAVS